MKKYANRYFPNRVRVVTFDDGQHYATMWIHDEQKDTVGIWFACYVNDSYRFIYHNMFEALDWIENEMELAREFQNMFDCM